MPASGQPLLAPVFVVEPEETSQLTLNYQEDTLEHRRDMARKAVSICTLSALVIGGAVCHTEVSQMLNLFAEWCGKLGWAGPVILGLLVSLLQLLMLPTFPLMVAAGVIFPRLFGAMVGQGVGIAAVFGGMWLGSMLAFYLGRKCLKTWAERELQKFEWMNVINAMIEDQGWWVVLLARASPLMPAEIFNYACSLTSLSLGGYAIGCLGSLVPTSIWVCSTASAATAANAAQEDNESNGEKATNISEHLAFLGINLIFLAALSLILYLAVQRYAAKANIYVDKHLERLNFGLNCAEDDLQRLRQDFRKTVHLFGRRKSLAPQIVALRRKTLGNAAFERASASACLIQEEAYVLPGRSSWSEGNMVVR